jgi:hypothetical protein
MRRRTLIILSAILGTAGLPSFTAVGAASDSLDASQPKTPQVTSTRTLPPGFLGTNIENAYGAGFSWTDPAVIEAIKSTKMQSVRFPGGDAANYWDWQTGAFWSAWRASESGPAVPDTLTQLARLVRATGVSPVYDLNVMTIDNRIVSCSDKIKAASELEACLRPAIEYQIAMLQAARHSGLSIRDLELGNEFFWQSADQAKAFPNGTDYADEMNLWAQVLKGYFPDITLAAVGSVPAPYAHVPETDSWNAQMLPHLKGFSAVTLHRYDGIVDGGAYEPQTAAQTLSFVFSDWATIKEHEIEAFASHGLQTWITEFGGFSDCTPTSHFSGTWVEGLYQAQMALQFLASSAITKMQIYNIAGSTGSIYFQDSSLYWNGCTDTNFSFNGTPGDLTATGQAYALISRALENARTVSEISLPVAKYAPPTPPGGWTVAPYPSATGIAVAGPKANQWVIINLVSEPLRLSYPGMGRGTMESLAGEELTTIVDKQSVLSDVTQPFDGAAFELPPYSINRLSVPVVEPKQ